MAPPVVIAASGLSKYYGALVAVDGIDFTVSQGESFGVLGPNGAGKTTTLKMVTCTLPIGSGSLHIQGMDVARQPRAIKAILGVVS